MRHSLTINLLYHEYSIYGYLQVRRKGGKHRGGGIVQSLHTKYQNQINVFFKLYAANSFLMPAAF